MNAKICHASLWRRGGFYARFYSVVVEATRASPSPSEARTRRITKTKAICLSLYSSTETSIRPIHAAVQKEEPYPRENTQRIPSDAELPSLRPAGRRKEDEADVSTTENTSEQTTAINLRTLNYRVRKIAVTANTLQPADSTKISPSPSRVFSKIEKLLQLSPERDSATYALLIRTALYHALKAPRYYRTAEGYFLECESKGLTDCYVLVLRLLQLTLEKRKDEVKEVSDRIQNESDPSDRLHSFVRIAKTLGWNNPALTIGLYEALRENTTFDEITYNTLLNSLLFGKHLKECYFVIDDMIKLQIVPNLIMFNTLIRRFTMYKESHRVWKIYDALLMNDHIPDERIATSLIAACTASSQFKRAYSIFESLPKLGIQPNSHCYSAILTAAAKAMDYPALQRYFDQMLASEVKPTQFHYAAVIKGCAFLDRFQDGWNMYLDMKKNGLMPDAHVGKHALKLCRRARRQAELEIVEQDLKDANITREDIMFRKSRKIPLHKAVMREKAVMRKKAVMREKKAKKAKRAGKSTAKASANDGLRRDKDIDDQNGQKGQNDPNGQ